MFLVWPLTLTHRPRAGAAGIEVTALNTRTLLPWIAACVFPAFAHAQYPGQISLASVDADGGVANADSSRPAVSAHGRYIAFDSEGTDVVPGDTNENTDVFVRDQVTGATERVSLTWKGQEPRGDSKCPSISDDGRYVAFLSNAWNMYAGGANLGAARWDVYLRDRHAGTTTRLSVAPGGAEPNDHSLCPSISGDGGRVVFVSKAALAPTDTNSTDDVYVWDRSTDTLELVSIDTEDGLGGGGFDATISGDGQVVAFASWSKLVPTAIPNGSSLIYVRDLETDTTTVGSLDPEGSFSLSPGANTLPALSYDGRYVAFVSRSRSYHGLPNADGGQNIIVYDRVDATWTASGRRRESIACGPPDARFVCKGHWVAAPALSGDGRYVTYSTRTGNLLPGTFTRGDQVFVFDRLTGRLRRISVGARGTSGNQCSLEPAISRDGETVVYRSSSTNIAGDADRVFDVVSSKWRCRDEGCLTPSRCPAVPQVCDVARHSTLRLKRNAPGGSHSDRFYWKWVGNHLDGDAPFGDPTDDTRYELCLYAHDFAQIYTDLDIAVLPGENWSEVSKGYVLRNGEGGLLSLSVRNLDRRSMIVAKGKGSMIDAPHLPLTAPTGVTVQLHDVAGDRCWSAYFNEESIEENHEGGLPSHPAGPGRFVAKAR